MRRCQAAARAGAATHSAVKQQQVLLHPHPPRRPLPLLPLRQAAAGCVGAGRGCLCCTLRAAPGAGARPQRAPCAAAGPRRARDQGQAAGCTRARRERAAAAGRAAAVVHQRDQLGRAAARQLAGGGRACALRVAPACLLCGASCMCTMRSRARLPAVACMQRTSGSARAKAAARRPPCCRCSLQLFCYAVWYQSL